ncbi:outer membrane beta-barrel protein [Aliiglaciecola sp. M165]|uniref:outer membrane beta-barrel protein n=1 Tax=Aliiglaciecola sp. M165 TaxID=2593649 RepID=UPI00117C4F77|nr:outer membrane beta-barrel protein [Aliiglaciecola sp. M165]TRY32851.1 outer membrane beta-barrel protein [Aliiglaciecola sp. M165]
MQIKRFAVATVAISMSTGVYSQEPGGIRLGGFQLIPAIEIGMEKDDNVTRSSTDQIESWKRTIAPEVILLNSFGANQFQVGYRIERGDYMSSEEDNYTDHFVSVQLDYELNSRHRTKSSLEYEDGHDARGTAFSIGLGETLGTVDTYKALQGEVVYSYGALTSDGRIDVNLGYRELDYDGEEEIFLVRDRSFITLGASFFYRLGALTDLVIEAYNTEVSYDFTVDGGASFDSTNRGALLGIQWETTAATTSYFKVGYQEKSFDAQEREKFSGFDWSAGVVWQPLDRTTLTFATSNDTDETNGEGNFINRRSYSVTWQHDWLERLSTRLQYSTFDDIYEGSANSREDDLTIVRFTTEYEFRRWLSFELYYQYDERESESVNALIDLQYDRNVFGLNARFTL